MKVLVLLSTYNGERYLREQIDSILNQKGITVGLLIRDDGSNDDTKSILNDYLAHYANIEVIYGKNVGCAESFRHLLDAAYEKMSEFDFFAFSDQDDFWKPEKLSVACDALKKMDCMKPCTYCSNVLAVDSKLNPIAMKWKNDMVFISKPQSLVCSMSYGCTMLFNKKVIEIFHQCPPRKLVLHDLWVMHMCMFLGDIHYDLNSYILYRQHDENVIGAKITFKARSLNRWKSIQHIQGQHLNEQEAQEMLYSYKGLLSEDDEKMIGIVANYRKELKIRLRFLFGLGKYYNEIRREKDNFWLLVRIVLGKV